MQRNLLLFLSLPLLLILLLNRCANPVSPQGGPKDIESPRVIACDPPLFTTDFNKKGFRIDFNEFIAIKNAATEILISPPMKKAPDTRLRGKSLLVDLNDTLVSNTTYSVLFGNSITDITEGNALAGFSYVFSTGSHIDSLALEGTVLSAFDLKPQKGVFVGLYIGETDSVPADSLPLRQPPYYITKSDENGNFVFNHIRPAECMLFAIADMNGDLIYNQLSEKIAFLDSAVMPVYIPPAIDAGLPSDSLTAADSASPVPPKAKSYELRLFEQADSLQRIVKSAFIREDMVMLVFRKPAEQLRFTPMNFDSVLPWCIPEFSGNGDSLLLWITRPATDSLILRVEAAFMSTDTLELGFEKPAGRSARDRDKPVQGLQIVHPSKGISFNQFKDSLILTFSHPLDSLIRKKIMLIENSDTLFPAIQFTDSVRRRIHINHRWQEDKSCRLLIPDSTFTGFNGLSHDTLFFAFRTKSERDLGNLYVTCNLPPADGRYLLQLLNEGETTVFGQKISDGAGVVRFAHLMPGRYKIKAIEDRNENGRWDSGNFRYRIQPERVRYYPKTIEIRANWDVEEIWN